MPHFKPQMLPSIEMHHMYVIFQHYDYLYLAGSGREKTVDKVLFDILLIKIQQIADNIERWEK